MVWVPSRLVSEPGCFEVRILWVWIRAKFCFNKFLAYKKVEMFNLNKYLIWIDRLNAKDKKACRSSVKVPA